MHNQCVVLVKNDMLCVCAVVLIYHFHFTRGRTGVFVCGLLPNSAAMECGKISIGDQIIEVNGVDMRNATVDEAADIMVSS